MYSSNPIKQHLIDLDYKRKAANKPAFLQSGGWIGPDVPNVNSNLGFAINYHNKKSRMGRARTRRSRQHGGILPALAAIPPAVVAAIPPAVVHWVVQLVPWVFQWPSISSWTRYAQEKTKSNREVVFIVRARKEGPSIPMYKWVVV